MVYGPPKSPMSNHIQACLSFGSRMGRRNDTEGWVGHFSRSLQKYGECALILQSGKLPKRRVEFRAQAEDS
jgi:hypothetical protein